MPDLNENKGRRVTDKNLLDSAQQAVRMEELNGRQNVLALQITQGLQAMRNAIEGTQSEVHRVVQAVERLAAFQQDHAANKEALDSLRGQLSGVSNRMEQWFTEFSKVQERKWDTYALDRDARWREHEADNENTARELRTAINNVSELEVRKLREKLIRWTGWGAGVGVLATLIVSVFMYHLNYRFNDNDKTTEQIEIKAEVLSRELAEIKLYLARGGGTPAERFNPNDTRNDDDRESQPAN